MEGDDRLILWGLQNKEGLNLEINKLSWTSKVGVKLYDFKTKAQIQHKDLSGRGTSICQKKALAISITECLERSVVNHKSISSSNGIAAHTNMALAILGAKKELVERDAFLTSYFAGLPVKKIDWSTYKWPNHILKTISFLENHGISVSIFEIGYSFGYWVTMAVVSGLKSNKNVFGINLGLGCEMDLTSSCEKAFLECMRNGVWSIFADRIDSCTLEHFLKKSKHGVQDHLGLCFDVDYGRHILTDIEDRTSNSSTTFDEQGQFEHSELQPQHKSLKSVPLHFIQVKNSALQHLFWGKTSPSKLNLKRLCSFISHEQLVNRISTLHPAPIT